MIDAKTGAMVVGAKVTLKKLGTSETIDLTSDFFGDFELKGEKYGQTYGLRVDAPGYLPKEIGVVSFQRDTFVGDIKLVKRPS